MNPIEGLEKIHEKYVEHILSILPDNRKTLYTTAFQENMIYRATETTSAIEAKEPVVELHDPATSIASGAVLLDLPKTQLELQKRLDGLLADLDTSDIMDIEGGEEKLNAFDQQTALIIGQVTNFPPSPREPDKYNNWPMNSALDNG